MTNPADDPDADCTWSVPVDGTFTRSSVEFWVDDVADGLYLMRIKSRNNLDNNGEPSGWSAAVGTGAPLLLLLPLLRLLLLLLPGYVVGWLNAERGELHRS